MPSIDMPLEQLRQYKPSLYREEDFESFWGHTIKEAIHQPLGAHDPHPQARPRGVVAAQDPVQISDTRPGIADAYQKNLRYALTFERELDAAAAGVLERVARDFGHGCGQTCLLL